MVLQLRLVNALCCAGLPAQLLKEVVLEARFYVKKRVFSPESGT